MIASSTNNVTTTTVDTLWQRDAKRRFPAALLPHICPPFCSCGYGCRMLWKLLLPNTLNTLVSGIVLVIICECRIIMCPASRSSFLFFFVARCISFDSKTVPFDNSTWRSGFAPHRSFTGVKKLHAILTTDQGYRYFQTCLVVDSRYTL